MSTAGAEGSTVPRCVCVVCLGVIFIGMVSCIVDTLFATGTTDDDYDY